VAIARTVLGHLEENRIAYEQAAHSHTFTSQETAEAAHVSGERLAKGVLLETAEGEYLLAVLPATHVVHYPDVESHYGTRVKPAAHDVLQRTFPDCEAGAIPPFGMLYGVRTAVEETLLDRDPVYFEAGDHESVVRVSAMDFRSLLFGAEFFAFAARPRLEE
jgi:Ala-tRNA(Pro) deacylase